DNGGNNLLPGHGPVHVPAGSSSGAPPPGPRVRSRIGVCAMTTFIRLTAALLAAATLAGAAPAQVTQFDLSGKAGAGLLPGNENPTVTNSTATGGEVGSGISFNTTTNVLTINVAWGSANGFSNLTGNATAGHIHGPTTSVAPAS